jgi:hypothetical protein
MELFSGGNGPKGGIPSGGLPRRMRFGPGLSSSSSYTGITPFLFELVLIGRSGEDSGVSSTKMIFPLLPKFCRLRGGSKESCGAGRNFEDDLDKLDDAKGSW